MTRFRRIANPRLLVLFCCALVGSACAGWDEVGRIYLRATPEGRALLERIEHYEAIAEKLQRYHDDGLLDAREVLDVLGDAGVIDPLPPPGGPVRPLPSPGEVEGSWIWPMKAGVVSSEFGTRGGRAHEGIDIAAGIGEPIYAASSGQVIYSDDRMSGYGNAIIVRHEGSTTSLYAHATTLVAGAGENVNRGDLIATVGSTGQSTGPHLHFEVRLGETAVDPRSVLTGDPF